MRIRAKSSAGRVAGGAVLVDHGDAVPGGVLQCPGDRVLLDRARDHREHGLAGLDVGRARHEAVHGPALGAGQLREPVDEGGRDHRRVGVDPGQVGDLAVDRPVDLGAGERPLLGPLALVPVEREHQREGAAPGVGGQRVERLGQRRRPREVDAERPDARLGQVHVRVHERRRHQPAAQVDDPVRAVREVHRRVVVAGPDDGSVLEAEGGGVRVGGRVDVATTEQDPHEAILTAPRACARRGPAHPGARRSSDSA